MAEQNPPKVKRTPVDFDPFAKGQDKKIKRTPVDFDPFAGSPPQTPPTDPFAQAPPQEQEGLTQGPSGSVDAYGDGLYQTSAAASPSALAAGSSASSSRPSVTEPLPPFGQQPPAPEQVAPPERNTAMETAMSTGDWKSSQALEAAQPKGLLDEEQRKNLQAEWDKLMVPGPKDTWQPPQRAKDIQKALETDKKVREIPAKLVNSALAAKDSPVFAQREDEVGPAQQYDWQNVDDPRRRQLEKEAVDYAQQDQTIFRYDPRKRQSMIDQGGWDNAKEASYQSSIISHAQEVVAGKQILLQRGIDSGAIDPQQAEQMKADIQSRANYVKAGWEAVQKLDPKTIQEKLNEQNQQVADIQHSMGLTGAGTATAQKIGEGAVSGVGNTMIKPLLMAYSKVFGDDSTYSTADRAIDAIAEVTSEMDSHVASHYKKQLFEKNEDGTTDFNPQSIVPQLAGGITELVPFLALSEAGAAAGASEGALFGNAALGASIGSKAAIFGTTYADTYDRYIRDTMAKDKNITEAEAKEGANIAATGTALLFAVNPNLDMAATQKKVGAKVFSQMADGVTKKDIVANLLKEIGKGGTTQAGLNFGVLAADNVANDAVNQLAGTNLPTEQTAHELLSSTAGAFLIGGALALGHGGSVSDMRAKAMRSAMEHPEAAKQVVKESSIPSEQKAQAYNNIDNARRDYVGNNLKRTGITDAKATQFVDNEAQIRQIKEHIKDNPPSDVVKEAKSDPRDAQLEKLYKEQRDILGIPEPEAKPSEAKKEPVALPKAKEEQPTEKKSDGNRSDRNGSVKKRADGAPEGGGKQPSAELPNNNRMGSGNPGNEASASAGAGQVPERGPGDAQGSQRGTKADQRVNAGDVVLPGRVLRGVDGDNAGGVSGTTEEVGAKDIYTQAPTAESPTTGVQVAEGKKRNAVVDAALEIAPKNDGATKSEAPTPDKVQGESVEPTATTGDGEAVRAADVAKPTSEVERLSDDALLGGQAEKNRKAGKREIAGQEYKRQAPQDAPEGKEGKVQFSEGVDVPFQYALMDADAIQPSHAAGRRNPLHFIPEAQPKPRTDAESQLAASRIAQAPDIDKVGSSPNAYSGAPIVNARGEVVQGNNRATGLKEHYKQGGTSYKQDLAKNADQYGLTAEQVDGMKNPILVRRIHTSDVKSIELGNYDAKDIESGGKGSIDPVAVSARIPTSAKASIAERLFGNSGDATLKSAIRESYSDLTKMLEPYLNPAQRNTLYSKGTNEPSARGMQELESLVKHFLFDGGAPELSEVFESLPHHAQAGITAAMPQILSSPESQAITKEVQNAVMSASAFRVSGVESFGAWAAQADAFGPSATEVYTPTEMAMAKLMAEAKTTKAVREKLNQYAGSTKPSEATMFDGASEGKSLQQAAEDVFGITSPKQNDQSADKSSGAKAPAGAVQAAEGSGVDAAKAGEGSNTRNAKDGSGELVQEQRGEAPQVPLTGVAHVDSVTKALSNLAPDLKVTVHKNGKAFNAALDGRGDPNSAAFYDRDAGEIHINLSRAKDNTLFHEAAHVVLAAAVDNNPVMLHELFKQLEGTPEFEKYKKFGALYGDKPISTRMEEAVAEYMADIGSGKARTSALPKSLYQKLKQWIKDMLAKLGFRAKDIKLDPTNLRKFAEDFAKAMTEGIKVRGEKVKQGERTSLQHDADRLVDGWYSRLDDAVVNKGNTQSGADWSKWMEARSKDGSLSAEEVKWTGLGDWLAGKGKEKVTPKEVREFLKENRVKVEVVVKGGGTKYTADQISKTVENKNGWTFYFGDVTGDTWASQSVSNSRAFTEEEAVGIAVDEMNADDDGAPSGKFSQYQLPGGQNYREVLVTLPNDGPSKQPVIRKVGDGPYPWKIFAGDATDGNHASSWKTEEEARAHALPFVSKTTEKFKSPHFNEPNILVHLRVNDRTDADGKKVLFVEEMQSDWGQKGKKEGFTSEKQGEQQVYYNKLVADGVPAFEAMDQAREKFGSGRIAPAPFVTDTNSWVELGVKQAIRMAVEGGYDKIAWTNGEQQNERYDLSKQVNLISVMKEGENSYLTFIEGKDGSPLFRGVNGFSEGGQKVMTAQDLEDTVGKDIAKNAVDGAEKSDGKWFDIEDDGLKIGGSGMKGFYDKILPNVAKKVSKKLGGDGMVGEVGIDTDRKRWQISPPSTTTSGKWMVKNALDPTSKGLHFDTEAEAQIALKGKVRSTQQQSIAITPEMRAKVGMGVPLMQLNPEKVAAAMRAEGFDAKAAKDYLEGENIPEEDKKAIILAMERVGAKAERSDLKKQVREAVKEAKVNLKLADKRANQGYRQGMAEGQLGGEIEGKKAGRKEGALEQRKLNRELADRVDGILDPLRSDVSPGQAKALVKAANKVQSDIQLENFQRVADKIIDDAEYRDRLDEADSIRSGIKKKLKSKEASKRNTLEQMGLFKELSQLDPSKVADLAEYTSIAERVRRNLDAIQVRNGEVQNADLAISNDELSGYLAGEITAQREQAKKDLIVQYEQMVKDGLLSGDLTLDQMKDIINASEDDLEAALEKSGADDKLTTLRDFAEAKLRAMNTGIFTANTPAEAEVLKNIMQIDPQRLPAKDLVRLNNVLNNIQVNADYSGSGFMSSVGKEHQNAADLVKAISGVRVQEASGDLDRLRTEAARIDAMTLDNKVASEARRLMGSDAYGDASHRVHAIGEHNLHDAEQEMKRLGLKAKDDTKPNRNLMFVYSWVIQNEGGTPAQRQAFFENQKAMIAQSIERLMDKSASSENKERGAIMKEAFKIAEDAKTPEEVRSNLEAINPALAKFVDWGVNKGKEVQERSFENKKINDNEVPTVVNNWTHAKQRSLMPTSVDDLGKNTFVGRNLDRSGSRSMISRVNSLGQGRVLDGDFISNLLEGWHQNNYANETQSDRMLMERMLNNTDVIQALGQHNVELLRQQAKRKTEGDKSAAQPMSKAEKKAVRAAHRVIRMGSGIALKSLTQLVKQPIVLSNVSTVLGKDIDLLFHPAEDVAGAMAGRMIEGRGEYMAGIEPTGRTITKGEAPLSNTPWQAVERGLTKVADVSDKLYKPLTGADVWSAKQTWKAFYLKSLRDRGMWRKGDSVVNDEQAAAYANHMTEKLQGSNSTTTMAQVYQTKGVTGLLRYMYMPFTSFSAQTRSRMVNDIQKIRLGTPEQKKEGARGLGATVIEQGTYNAAKVAIYAATLAAAKMAIQGLFGYDDNKDKDGNDIERDNHTTSKFFQAFAEDVMAPGWPQMMKSAAEMIINDIATTVHPATTNKEGKRVPYEGPAYVYDPSKYGQSDLSQLGAAASAVQMGQKLWDNRDYWDGMIYETTRGGDSPYSPAEVERLTRLGLPTGSDPDRQGPTREETLRLTPKERAAMVAVNVSRMGALLGFSETQINTMMTELEKETKHNIGKRAKLNAFQKYSYPKSLVNDMVEVQAANYNAATDKVAAMKEADKAFREKMSPAQYKKAMKLYGIAKDNPDLPFFYIRLANKAGVDDRAQALFDKYASVPKEEHKEVIRNATIAGVLTDDVKEKFKKLILESKAEDAVNRTKAKE